MPSLAVLPPSVTPDEGGVLYSEVTEEEGSRDGWEAPGTFGRVKALFGTAV